MELIGTAECTRSASGELPARLLALGYRHHAGHGEPRRVSASSLSVTAANGVEQFGRSHLFGDARVCAGSAMLDQPQLHNSRDPGRADPTSVWEERGPFTYESLTSHHVIVELHAIDLLSSP